MHILLRKIVFIFDTKYNIVYPSKSITKVLSLGRYSIHTGARREMIVL